MCERSGSGLSCTFAFVVGPCRAGGTAGGGAREAGRDGGHGVPEHTDPYLLMETGCVQIGGPSGPWL